MTKEQIYLFLKFTLTTLLISFYSYLKNPNPTLISNPIFITNTLGYTACLFFIFLPITKVFDTLSGYYFSTIFGYALFLLSSTLFSPINNLLIFLTSSTVFFTITYIFDLQNYKIFSLLNQLTILILLATRWPYIAEWYSELAVGGFMLPPFVLVLLFASFYFWIKIFPSLRKTV